jgi:hypothetical protein
MRPSAPVGFLILVLAAATGAAAPARAADTPAPVPPPAPTAVAAAVPVPTRLQFKDHGKPVRALNVEEATSLVPPEVVTTHTDGGLRHRLGNGRRDSRYLRRRLPAVDPGREVPRLSSLSGGSARRPGRFLARQQDPKQRAREPRAVLPRLGQHQGARP